MGQAKRRREAIGELYGTPAGSNKPLIAFKGFTQNELDQKALERIQVARSAGQPVIVWGTRAAQSLVEAAGIAWLHELRPGEPIPREVAWDPTIAELGGPMLPPDHCTGGVLIIGAGLSEWMTQALAGSKISI